MPNGPGAPVNERAVTRAQAARPVEASTWEQNTRWSRSPVSTLTAVDCQHARQPQSAHDIAGSADRQGTARNLVAPRSTYRANDRGEEETVVAGEWRTMEAHVGACASPRPTINPSAALPCKRRKFYASITNKPSALQVVWPLMR